MEVALREGYNDMVQPLVQHGADPTLKGHENSIYIFFQLNLGGLGVFNPALVK